MSAPARLPLFLDLRDRPVVVVGGGPVAARRTADLSESGARVTVVSPHLCEDLADAAERGAVRWVPRDYRSGDLDGAWLVVTATGGRSTDAQVVSDAEQARIWAVNAGDAAQSPAWSAARVPLEDGAAVAVSGGRDPRRAKALASAISQQASQGRLPLRRHRAGVGRVHLVGGGPGDPGLLTVRGMRLLSTADVVVVDRLAPREVLEHLPDRVEVVDVGKAPGEHTMSQDEINALLVDRARRGEVVVRLKGGDPFVLGRGGEEVAACRAEGIEVDVVPGVTSVVAVPAAAGIPVTHRGVACSFLMVSAHTADEALERTRAATPGTTLVLLMGVGRLRTVTEGMVGSGWDPATPVGIVERGWQADQRETYGTLADIADLAQDRGVRSPAVIVIGDVVGVGRELSGEHRQLEGEPR
jgi:uroporphyrin-III C-methyltransferase/precorrin-2 dehydrogenase/sirohydrochlorin ferrochelatase